MENISGNIYFWEDFVWVWKNPIQLSYEENVIQEGHIHAYIFICNLKNRRIKKRFEVGLFFFPNRILVKKWEKLTETG